MPLMLVLGPANSAKAGEVLGAYADAAARGALLVVPTRLDAEHYARELAAERTALGTVLTFSGLAAEIARRADYAGRRLSGLQRERVVARAVGGASLQALAASAEAAGFARAAGDLIAELERSLITPQRFAQALEAWSAEDRRRSRYARDLASLYAAYDRELARLGRVDADLFAWRAIDALRSAPGRWGTDAVFFYGFDDLTALERDAVETLARVVGVDVTVSLTFEPGHAALTARAEVVEELRPLAERVLELPALDEHYAASVLHSLERGLFESGVERVDPGDAVLLLEAGGERSEAELVAAEVLSLLRAGWSAAEIVVVCRSPARSAPALARVFEEYGIPLVSEHRIPFTHTPLGSGVAALVRVALRGSPEDLLEYLRSPGRLERPELADSLEAFVRREGVLGLDEAVERLGWSPGEIDAVREAAEPLAELVRQARRLFARPHRGQAPSLSTEEELDARALAGLARAAEQLDELAETVALAELPSLLEEIEVPFSSRGAEGAILLADPLAIRARRFRAVFVCGLQEGEFPLPGAPEPFLSDERRFELGMCAGLRLRPREDALARERYLFYACVSRATERLVLSYRSSDEEGNLCLPSPFIADVAELLDAGWSSRRRKRLLADVVWPAECAPTEREAARAAAVLAGAGPGEEVPPVYQLSEMALSHVRHRDVVSGGALESFAACPVKWLVERELQPERFEPDPDPIVRGSVMHASLEALLRRLGGPVTSESLAAALSMVDEVLSGIEIPVAVGRGEGARAAARTSIAADLRRYLRHEAANGCTWKPVALELRFGFEDAEQVLPERRSPLPLLELSDDVRLRGVIDRVDGDGAGHAIVRDYKSGSASPRHAGARWSTDGQLQVALYMLAVRELLGLEPVAGLYQPLGGGDLRTRGVYVEDAPVGECVYGTDARSEEALEDVLSDARERAVEVARRLRSGELVPCPQSCSSRGGCSYPGICRA